MAGAEIDPSASLAHPFPRDHRPRPHGPSAPPRPPAGLTPRSPIPPAGYSLPLLAPRLRGALHLVRLVGLDDVALLDETPAPPLHHLGTHREEGAGAALPAWALALLHLEEVVEAGGGGARGGRQHARLVRGFGLEQGALLGPPCLLLGQGQDVAVAAAALGPGLRAPARSQAEGGLGQPAAGAQSTHLGHHHRTLLCAGEVGER